MTSNNSDDNKVGRGRPPKYTQFKKGVSGNPGGRKKQSRNLKTIMMEVLESEIELNENGRRRTVPLVVALVLRQVQEALKGQPRSIEYLLERYSTYTDRVEQKAIDLPADDWAMIERAIKVGRSLVTTDGQGLADEACLFAESPTALSAMATASPLEGDVEALAGSQQEDDDE